MLKAIKYKYGTANVLFKEGKARPYQITVTSRHDVDAQPKLVSLKTEKAVIKRLNANHEAHLEAFEITQK